MITLIRHESKNMDQRAVNAPLGNIGKYAPPPAFTKRIADMVIDQKVMIR